MLTHPALEINISSSALTQKLQIGTTPARLTRWHAGGAAAAPTLTLGSGDLGSVTVSVAGASQTTVTGRAATSLSAPFPAGGGALAVTLSFSGARLSVADATAAVAKQRAATLAALAAGSKRAAGQDEDYEAMSTVIAWNVNYDPRVAVTAPVRTPPAAPH